VAPDSPRHADQDCVTISQFPAILGLFSSTAAAAWASLRCTAASKENGMSLALVRVLGWLVIAHGVSHAVLPLRGSIEPAVLLDDWTPVVLYGAAMIGCVGAGLAACLGCDHALLGSARSSRMRVCGLEVRAMLRCC
jgi:hypothetical protein